MYPVSAEFLAALRAPHQMTARIELWAGDTRLTGALAFSDGVVTLDRTNQVFGTCEVTAQLTRTQGLVVQDGVIDINAVDVYGLTLRPTAASASPAAPPAEADASRRPRWAGSSSSAPTTTSPTPPSPSKHPGSDRCCAMTDSCPRTPPPLDTPQREVLRKLITDSRPGDPLNTTEWNALRTTPVARGTTWETDRLTAVDELATAGNRRPRPSPPVR